MIEKRVAVARNDMGRKKVRKWPKGIDQKGKQQRLFFAKGPGHFKDLQSLALNQFQGILTPLF